jgi:hypothetical protein
VATLRRQVSSPASNPAFSYIYDFPDDPTGTFEGSAWETYLTTDGAFSDSDSDATDVGVISLTLPKGRVRPFADFYLVDLLERGSVGAHLLFGVDLLVP